MKSAGQTSCGAILVADDDAGVRRLIVDAFEGAGHATLAAETGWAAATAAAERELTAAILDVELPGVSGYAVCRALRERHGDSLPVVFVSGTRVEPYDRVAGLLVGADDYVVKPFAPEELVLRLERLLARAPRPPHASHLTARETEVLRLLAQGLDQREIARRLVISSKTVATHIERILGKLGVHSRAQAVAAAYRDELLAG